VITYGDKKVIQRICRDVTETWNLHQRNEYMKQYFRSILDMMPIGLGVRKNIDKTPEVEFENRNLIDMFKRVQEQGCDCAWHEGDNSGRVDVTPAVNQNGVYAEERVFPNDKVFQFTANYFRDFENNWRELQIVQDVTERHRLQQQLQAANEELEHKVLERTRELEEKHAQLLQAEKMALLGNLVAGVAHEINTPLGALKSNYDLFVRSMEKLHSIAQPAPDASDEDKKQAAKLFESIRKLNSINETATERIVNIVNSLRTFARLDQAEMDSFDLHEGIENTLVLVAHELKNRIEVVKDYGSLPMIECFPNQLNQVFMNILVNAAQAIEGDGTIGVTTRAEDGWVSVVISDSGKGIPREDQWRIFDPGFTTKSAGVGTGLGLSIVHQIVGEHGGTIEVESRPGEGAVFTIKLPIK
ncbi:MAG: ATP-binding protein, partial [candidate division Zixibacteria bacterium]|nr:ATP-binding protein [candidate division Zixibacteria bacterium]